MFSQYSWWDFAKFCLALAIPYYAYVLWTYYRQDIREWLSNRGQPELKLASASEDEDDTEALYSVSHYASSAPLTNPAQMTASVRPPADQPDVAGSHQAQQSNASQPVNNPSEPDLNGLALDPEDGVLTDFGVPVSVDTERPAEKSLSELMSAAQRIQENEAGILVPADPADTEAANIADVINQQQGRKALSGIAFTR